MRTDERSETNLSANDVSETRLVIVSAGCDHVPLLARASIASLLYLSKTAMVCLKITYLDLNRCQILTEITRGGINEETLSVRGLVEVHETEYLSIFAIPTYLDSSGGECTCSGVIFTLSLGNGSLIEGNAGLYTGSS